MCVDIIVLDFALSDDVKVCRISIIGGIIEFFPTEKANCHVRRVDDCTIVKGSRVLVDTRRVICEKIY